MTHPARSSRREATFPVRSRRRRPCRPCRAVLPANEFLRGYRLAGGIRQGTTDFRRLGYGGPCPPIGRHRYFFKLFALDTRLPELASPDRTALERAMADQPAMPQEQVAAANQEAEKDAQCGNDAVYRTGLDREPGSHLKEKGRLKAAPISLSLFQVAIEDKQDAPCCVHRVPKSLPVVQILTQLRSQKAFKVFHRI